MGENKVKKIFFVASEAQPFLLLVVLVMLLVHYQKEF